MKKTLILLAFLLILPMGRVRGGGVLHKLDIHVLLNDDGSANVTEIRQVTIGDEGTEGFITFNNMGDITLSQLHVTDEKGISYTVETEWDVQRTRQQKKNRCGYRHTDQGVELCWGMGDPGERTYVISYTLTNLVKAYNDYDGFCHSFYEAANTAAYEASVRISLDHHSLTTANAALWTFGYHGYKRFINGTCEATTSGPMSDQESVIVLLQLKKGLLHPAVAKPQSFSETLKRRALEGSSYNLTDAGLDDNVSRSIPPSLLGSGPGRGFLTYLSRRGWLLVSLAPCLLVFLIYMVRSIRKEDKQKELIRQQRKEKLRQLMGNQPYHEVPYFRNIPLNGNLIISAETLSALDEMIIRLGGERINFRFRLQYLYEALLLRMLYTKQIQIVHHNDNNPNTTPQQLFRIQPPVKPQPAPDITDNLHADSMMGAEIGSNAALPNNIKNEALRQMKGYINDAGILYQLQKLLYHAAGGDHLLQPQELRQYVHDNPTQLRHLSTILNILTEKTIPEEQLQKENILQVVGFLRYLRDFSLVAERNIHETHLWKEYLVYASLYGIAEQVRSDMHKIAPDLQFLNPPLPFRAGDGGEAAPLISELSSSFTFTLNYVTTDEKQQYQQKLAELHSSSGGSGTSSYHGGAGHSGGGGSGFR